MFYECRRKSVQKWRQGSFLRCKKGSLNWKWGFHCSRIASVEKSGLFTKIPLSAGFLKGLRPYDPDRSYKRCVMYA